jgi:hypothetical protein
LLLPPLAVIAFRLLQQFGKGPVGLVLEVNLVLDRTGELPLSKFDDRFFDLLSDENFRNRVHEDLLVRQNLLDHMVLLLDKVLFNYSFHHLGRLEVLFLF